MRQFNFYNCWLTVLVVFGLYSHVLLADAAVDSNEVVRLMLRTADLARLRHVVPPGTRMLNYASRDVFFGKIDTGPGWSRAGREAAFQSYMVQISSMDFSSASCDRPALVNRAVWQCRAMDYTNVLPWVKALALNTTYPKRYRNEAVHAVIALGGLCAETTGLVEDVITNEIQFTEKERGRTAWEYARLVRTEFVPTNHLHVAAAQVLYQNRHVDVGASMGLDMTFSSCLPGYMASSNRYAYATWALQDTEIVLGESRRYFSAITNQLLSSGQPLRQLNFGEAGE